MSLEERISYVLLVLYVLTRLKKEWTECGKLPTTESDTFKMIEEDMLI